MALDTNLTAYYKFDNGAVTADSVASFTLTNTGTVASTASGKIGYGADFGNPNTTKWLTQTGFTFNSYPISISGWFYPNVVNDNGNLFSIGEASTDYYQVKLRNTDSHIVFRSNNATQAADVDTGIVASTNTWYHVVVVFNSTTNVDIYVNGTATNTSATVFVAGSLSKFAIGALARGTPIQPYSGIADEIGFWTRALTASDVTQLYNGGVGLNPITLTTSIISYWKLDESSGNAADSVGSNTLTNTNTVTYAAGKINNGADFGASNTNKKLTNTGAGGIDGGAISFSCWIKPTALPTSDADPYATSTFSMMSQGNSSSSAFYSMHLSNVSGTQRVYFTRFKNSVGSTGAYGDSTTSTSVFTHIVGTYDGTTLKVYINGSLQANTVTDSGTGSSGSSFINIGNRNTVAFFSGMVDEAGMWSRALSSTEVTELYNGGAGIQYPFVTNYPITADVGTFALTGIANNLLFGRKLVADVGTFLLTGIDVAFNKGYGMIASVGSFILTGIGVVLRLRRWTKATKSNTDTYTQASKSNTSTWTKQSKS